MRRRWRQRVRCTSRKQRPRIAGSTKSDSMATSEWTPTSDGCNCCVCVHCWAAHRAYCSQNCWGNSAAAVVRLP
eukprot:6962415-Alexandrium_andersonii.AAC.1